MLLLVTGGARSGKSDFALSRAVELAGGRKKYFVATCPSIDAEIDQRIAQHQQDRQGLGFETVEEQLQVAEALKTVAPGSTVLLDCVTLWINNLLYWADKTEQLLDEEQISQYTQELICAAKQQGHTLICVTNELGMGVVPADPLARKYRDLVGRCNRILAAASDGVYMVTCGIAVTIKDNTKK